MGVRWAEGAVSGAGAGTATIEVCGGGGELLGVWEEREEQQRGTSPRTSSEHGPHGELFLCFLLSSRGGDF